MISDIFPLLEKKGLRFLDRSDFPGKIYYSMREGCCHVVWIFSGEDAGFPDVVQAQNMQQQLRELFLYPQGRIPGCDHNMVIYQVEMLTMVLTRRIAYGRQLCSFCRNCWLLDETQHILMIYENQPGDFMGLRVPLQQALDQSARREMNGGKWKQALRRLPVVNIGIVALNILIFMILSLSGDMESGYFVEQHGGMFPLCITEDGEWWRLITSMFLHFGVQHLANNMLVLFCTGDKLELAVGRWKYMLIYFGSGICGGMLSLWMMIRQQDYAVSAGASGAVFGVIGALLWIVIRNRGRLETLTTRRMVLMIVLSLYLGFTGSGVDNWCHVGGVAGGFLLSVLLYRRKADTP